ncbi:MAG: hypothetical protein Q9191_000019 [Dirinaria sp. TL-2023a]
MAQLTWLVTGCSSGFGEQFVYSVLARGDRVIATGRKADQRLAHLKGTGAAILELDVSAPEAEIQSKAQQAIKIYDGIDVLVNNAGYLEVCVVEECSYERWLTQFETKFFGTINLTRAIIPHMREKRSGTIVNIGSIFGWRGNAACAAYNASNAALRSFTESLQIELASFNIRSIVFEPGHFSTKITSQANARVHLSEHKDYQSLILEFNAALHIRKGNEPGNPKLGAERMIDLVRSEGAAEGRPMPARLPLGTDALQIIKDKCLETVKICDEWEDFIKSTDYKTSA